MSTPLLTGPAVSSTLLQAEVNQLRRAKKATRMLMGSVKAFEEEGSAVKRGERGLPMEK